MHLDWQFKPYKELTINEFHDIIALRLKAFVVEQNCSYLDLDGKDKKAYHLLLRDGKGDVIATARILHPGISFPEVAIGRVVLTAECRGAGVGIELMEKCVQFVYEEFGKVPIRISAQKHLEKFYNKSGFVSTGKEYYEDEIPHVEMLLNPENNG
ncbi:putative acyltransferase [compost metagenome]|uniref:GNAT family N-acetyltransferase n=1 Tax=Fluviicola sp. TaxID=1917219 RepID=UPI000F5C541B|nr:GNAT family N-acetyltransferase [Fluviicola sp.]